MLIYTVFGIIESTTNTRVLHLGGFIGLLYTSWAIGQFFDGSKKVNFLKGFITYLLGMITFTIGVIILGFGLDFIQKIQF